MILEAALLAKLVAGAKVIAAHGGLASTLASQAVTTAGTAGVGAAAAQTVGAVAAVGATAAVVQGVGQVADGVASGRPGRVAVGAARAASGGHWIHTH